MEKQINVYKAQGRATRREIDGQTIFITEPIPSPYEMDTPIEDADRIFERDAQKLEEALYGSLPGGTYSRLLGLMLKRRACHFVVSFASLEEKP